MLPQKRRGGLLSTRRVAKASCRAPAPHSTSEVVSIVPRSKGAEADAKQKSRRERFRGTNARTEWIGFGVDHKAVVHWVIVQVVERA